MNQTTSALAEYSCRLERLYCEKVLKKLRMLDLVCNAPTVQARGNDLTSESYHELMRTSREEAERVPKENLLHCPAEAALGGHDLGEWQETTGPGDCRLPGEVQVMRKDFLRKSAGGVQSVG